MNECWGWHRHHPRMMNPDRIACFFSTSGYSGVDRAAAHLIPALARRGYRVDLLKVRGHGPRLTTVPAGVRVVDLGARHTLACLPAVARYLRDERPGVLLSDKDKVNRIALFAHRLSGVPTRLIFSIGTTVSVNLASRGFFERRIQRMSMRRLYPFAHQVIVCSAGIADDMSDYTGLARDRIRVVPRPVVPAGLFAEPPPVPDHPWFGQADIPLILGVGALCARKDFATLLRAFARVRAERPCRLMILGRGNYREQLLSLAGELGIAEDFSLPGFLPEPYAYMAHADLFAFTSRWEGLGFVLIGAGPGNPCGLHGLSERTARNPRGRTLWNPGADGRRRTPRRGHLRDPRPSPAWGGAQAGCPALRDRGQHGCLYRGHGSADLMSGGVAIPSMTKISSPTIL